MKLRRLTDYALRVLIYVAETPGRRCSVPEIAAAHSISEHHLVKVAHRLGQLGYLSTARGRGGGLSLSASPEAINLGEVVRKLEGDDCPVDCSSCILARRCTLSGLLNRATQAFYDDLSRQTLADLIRLPNPTA
ncbi:RrF2 family transcriptional regulator [Phenylobacterium conjunctum]|jgi:Rrf2 family nitric oxide-sensitive transcriptional repressor|uniref:RrF2 family transcriptional regulator n=1 Tax=Phenylobacterium conjunctum TaxID=1298959 RepID=A0ABW3T2R8_9CAUL